MIGDLRFTGVLLFLFAVGGLFFVSRFWPKVPPHPMLNMVPRDTMQIILSLALTAASLYIILSHQYEPKDTHWAYGTIGTVLGFWLRAK
jgi:succinate dehydrogenase hydrophobic anchor subunit